MLKVFFDNASLKSSCGCGMVLSLNKDNYFTLCLCEGKGTNTKAEIMSLWGLLQFVSLIGISYIISFVNLK